MRWKCEVAGCREYKDYPGKCANCKKRSRRSTDIRRGTATQRGYGKAHQNARDVVLERDPFCQCTADWCHSTVPLGVCWEVATVADHWPLSRKDLVSLGKDPNDPKHMRGLCERCHNKREHGK